MTKLAEPSTPSGSVENSTTKATDHALQKYDNFTRYGHSGIPRIGRREPARSSSALEPNARTTGTIAPLKVMHASNDKPAP